MVSDYHTSLLVGVAYTNIQSGLVFRHQSLMNETFSGVYSTNRISIIHLFRVLKYCILR